MLKTVKLLLSMLGKCKLLLMNKVLAILVALLLGGMVMGGGAAMAQTVVPKNTLVPSTGQCSSTADCPCTTGLETCPVCVSGQCLIPTPVPQCSSTADCPCTTSLGVCNVCVLGQCVRPTMAPIPKDTQPPLKDGQCANDGDCPCTSSYPGTCLKCISGICRSEATECLNDGDCPCTSTVGAECSKCISGKCLRVAPGSTCPNGEIKKPGDADCDQVIGLKDFLIWKREYMGAKVGPVEASGYRVDFNGDSKIMIDDFFVWLGEFGK